MKHAYERTLGLAVSALFVAGVFVALPSPAAASTTPIRFGMDVGAITPLTNAGVKPDYASMWVGPWTLKSGWGGVDSQLDRMYSSGVTPAIQFYYWGNDISKNCLENGCWSSIHNTWKSKSQWQTLAQGLASHLNSHMKGRSVVIILETEFNKNDVSTYEALDGYLESKAKYFHSAYPASKVVLGFGNWGSSNWGTFNRAAAASNYAGIQAMRASTRDSTSSYTGAVQSLVSGATALKSKFAKPVFITDVALSTHSEPSWLWTQQKTLKALFDRRSDLKAAGVTGIVYRSFYDAGGANTNEYYGEAERHWGLVWSGNKTAKPALKVWVSGVKAERSGPTSTSTTPTTTSLLEVERFATKTTGGLKSCDACSHDASWNLWSNGYAQNGMSVSSSGTYAVKVRAGGMQMDGVNPVMRILVDGTERWKGSVAANTWRDYTASPSLGAGSHTLRIQFVNDASGGGEDRNLFVDRVTVTKVG